eukprot:scaffold1312_cov393-Prasinococcus_capsulatus_cf.AAC.20
MTGAGSARGRRCIDDLIDGSGIGSDSPGLALGLGWVGVGGSVARLVLLLTARHQPARTVIHRARRSGGLRVGALAVAHAACALCRRLRAAPRVGRPLRAARAGRNRREEGGTEGGHEACRLAAVPTSALSCPCIGIGGGLQLWRPRLGDDGRGHGLDIANPYATSACEPGCDRQTRSVWRPRRCTRGLATCYVRGQIGDAMTRGLNSPLPRAGPADSGKVGLSEPLNVLVAERLAGYSLCRSSIVESPC